MQSKKRVHLQQFDIIHLPNPDLIYIRNREINKIMLVPFHLLKTYIRNTSLLFISFFTIPPTRKRRGNHDPCAHICAWGGKFCQIFIFTELVCQIVRGKFFLFYQN
jgi:hypothetical protein